MSREYFFNLIFTKSNLLEIDPNRFTSKQFRGKKVEKKYVAESY